MERFLYPLEMNSCYEEVLCLRIFFTSASINLRQSCCPLHVFPRLDYTDIYGYSLSSCWVKGKPVASATSCNLVFLLPECRVFPPGVPWAVACRPYGLAGNSTPCCSDQEAILLTFFLLFHWGLHTCISIHSSFISILIFSVSSCNVSMTSKYGKEVAWTIQTMKRFHHA